MPQPAQHSLLHVLLLWITILSIIQIVFVTLFFTGGQHGLSQNSSAVAPEQSQPIKKLLQCSSENELCLGEGKLVSFKADKASNKVHWVAKTECECLVSAGESLMIKKDGFYILNLQVTMTSCEDGSTVHLRNGQNKILLHGWINNKTCSTGLLSKVEGLSAGVPLEVHIHPPTRHFINESEYLTYLDIIYMFSL